MTNRLYYGDNLQVLRDYIADASVDLIYLDPPFNSNAGYISPVKKVARVEMRPSHQKGAQGELL